MSFISGFDSYNLCLTGDIGRTIATPSGGLNEHIPIVILNDQGGSVMDVSEDVTATLRAQDHGHPPVVCFVECNSHLYVKKESSLTIRAECHGAIPVICFEPGIAKREGSDSRFVTDKSVTLRAQMGDNQPAICFQQNQREEVRDMGEQTGALTAESGMHNTNYVMYPVDKILCFKERAGCPGGGKGILAGEEQAFTLATSMDEGICYAVDSHPMDSRFELEGNIAPTVTSKLAKGAADGPLVLIENG